MIATSRLVMEGGLCGRPTECTYAVTLRLRDVAIATTFWLSMGYNFSCMTASDTLFDSSLLRFSVRRFVVVPGPIFAKLCHTTRYVLK